MDLRLHLNEGSNTNKRTVACKEFQAQAHSYDVVGMIFCGFIDWSL